MNQRQAKACSGPRLWGSYSSRHSPLGFLGLVFPSLGRGLHSARRYPAGAVGLGVAHLPSDRGQKAWERVSLPRLHAGGGGAGNLPLAAASWHDGTSRSCWFHLSTCCRERGAGSLPPPSCCCDPVIPSSDGPTTSPCAQPPALSLLGELHSTKPCTQAGLAGWGCTQHAAPTEPGGISPEMLKPLFYCRQTSLQEGEGCGTASTSLRARGTGSHCFTPEQRRKWLCATHGGDGGGSSQVPLWVTRLHPIAGRAHAVPQSCCFPPSSVCFPSPTHTASQTPQHFCRYLSFPFEPLKSNLTQAQCKLTREIRSCSGQKLMC